MKKLISILLLTLSMSVNAQCYVDVYGYKTCITTDNKNIDIRNNNNSVQMYENGIYRGNINNNVLDPNSVNNPLGKYGNQFSPDSLKNPFREGR